MAGREVGQGKVWVGQGSMRPPAAGAADTRALVVCSGWFSQHVCRVRGGVGELIDQTLQAFESTGCERPGAVASALTHHQVPFEMV